MKHPKINMQSVLFRLVEFWGKFGCIIIPSAQTEIASPLFHPSSFFEIIDDDKNCDIMYFQPHLASKEFRNIKYNVQNYSLLKFQVVIKSEIEMPQKLIIDSLLHLGFEMENNDIQFVYNELDDFVFGFNAKGHKILFNNSKIARIYYMQNIGCGESKSIPLSISYDIDKILMLLQNINNMWDTSWNGEYGEDEISYRDLMFVRERENFEFIADNSTNEQIFKEFESHRDTAIILLKNNIIIPAYISILKARHCLDILNFRNYITYNNKINHNKKIRELINLCCSQYITNKKENQ